MRQCGNSVLILVLSSLKSIPFSTRSNIPAAAATRREEVSGLVVGAAVNFPQNPFGNDEARVVGTSGLPAPCVLAGSPRRVRNTVTLNSPMQTATPHE